MGRSLPAVVACLAAGVTSTQAMQAPDSGQFAGAWKLNLSKSIYEGTSAPSSLTVSVEDRGDGLVVARSEAVLPNGSQNVTASAFKCDGKDYPFVVRQSQSVPLVMSCVAANARTYEIELKQEDGEPLQKTVRTLAEDGGTMTDTVSALLPDGQQVRVVAVLEKQ